MAIGLVLADEFLDLGSTLAHGATVVAIATTAGLAAVLARHRRVGHGTAAVSAGPHAAVSQTSDMEELLRGKASAEAASAAKSRYLASVSHEIRSPLNAIYGYAQLVENDAGVDPQEAARVIRRSAEHLTSLVDGLLDMSLVENGVLRVHRDVVRLPALIDQIVSMFRPAAAVKGLAFECDLPERLPEFVRTDQKRLRQVLINLLSNAIKFTQAGTVTLRLTYVGQIATFEICDTGLGISEEDRERIFAPFERVGGDGRPQHGTGLGLPITRAMVQILGGALELESTPGEGSCFRVRLMLGHVAGYRETGTKPRKVVGYEGARRSILVIDDDPEQLSLMRQVLGGLGFDVALGHDGDTALAQYHAERFDLALLDLAMPGRSGWETAAHLRATQGDAIKIVILSGNAHERDGPETGAHHHDLFLVKPVEIGALVDAIGDLLDLVWVRDSGGEPVGGPIAAAALPAQPGGISLPDPARCHVEKLRELLRIGHVRGIEAEIRQLETAAPDARGLVAALYGCLDRFDLSGLAQTLEGI